MPIVPQSALSCLPFHLEQLLIWLSDLVYDQLVARDPDHILVKLRYHLDFSPIEAACASFHHASGPGAQPIHSVPRLIRALLVSYLFNWSLRSSEWQIRFNLMVKWFVGYPIFAPGPDHTTLERFQQWAETNRHRLLFDEILRQIDSQFPEEREHPQVGDTFAMQANAEKQPLVKLLRHSARQLLSCLRQADPDSYERVMLQVDHRGLFGASDELSEFWLDDAGKRVRLQGVVVAAEGCIEVVEQEIASCRELSEEGRQQVECWLTRLAKVLVDEVEVEKQGEGEVVVRRVEKHKDGIYRMGSATDPEATYRVHGEQKNDLGYNVSLAASASRNSEASADPGGTIVHRQRTGFIWEIRADTGAQPDGVGIAELIKGERGHHGFVPAKLIYDQAGGTGKNIADVAKASDGQTQLVVRVVELDKNSSRFAPADFELSEDGISLRCPGGKVSQIAYRFGPGDGRTFRFYVSQCEGCLLWVKCRGEEEEEESGQEGGEESPPEGKTGAKGVGVKGKRRKRKKERRRAVKGKRMRQVFISDYRRQVEKALAYEKTEEFKADMKLRPLIERVISVLVRYGGARRARRIGLEAADFQAKMCATVYNLKEWMRRVGEPGAFRSREHTVGIVRLEAS